MKFVLLALIALYRKLISPYRAPSCRFIPSCSVYAKEAIEAHGAFRGLKLAFSRLLRCQPLVSGGYDPVVAKLD